MDGDQLVGVQPHPAAVPVQGDPAQVPAILPRRNDIGLPHLDGPVQHGVGVSRDDQVDALHRPGQLIVFPPSAVGARVGQADHHRLHPVLGQAVGSGLLHHPPGGVLRVMEHHARHGGGGVGVRPHQAEHGKPHAPPLQQHVVGHAIVGKGVPHSLGGFVIARLPLGGGQVVGLHNGGQGIPAVQGGPEHIGQAGGPIVIVVIAKGGHVIAHGPHGPQLQGRGGIGGLEEGAHGEVPPVQQQRVRIRLALGPDGAHQPSIAAVRLPILPGGGQQVGVQVVGEQHRDLAAGRLPGGQGRHGQRQ